MSPQSSGMMFAWADKEGEYELVSSSHSAFPSGYTERETGISSGGGEDVDDGRVNRGGIGTFTN